MAYFGYGIEGRLATDDPSRVDAGIVSAAGLRIQIPLHSYARRQWDEPAPDR